MNCSRGVRQILLLVMVFLLMICVQGCSNQYEEAIQQTHSATKSRLANLGRKIESRQLSNVLLIRTYASKLGALNPDLREVTDLLGQDASTDGPMYSSLLDRLNRVNLKPDNKAEFAPAFQELDSIYAASDPAIYNDSLLDVVNTLADLSEGSLPRVNIPKGAETASVQGGQVPGSYLVGNPNYGQWSRDSSGGSFWEWYGKYALFSSIFRGFGGGYYGGPIGYDSWYGRNRYSYYHDYGRSTYGSWSDRRSWDSGRSSLERKGIKTPKPKSYGSVSGRKRVSTYSSMRKSGASSFSTPSRSYSSSSSGKKTSTFFGGSSRGTSYGSRSGFGGK